MKKFIIMFMFTFLFSDNTLWIYTDLNYVKPISCLKKKYVKYHPEDKIQILKAPLNVLIKKILSQKKADILIVDNLSKIDRYKDLIEFQYNKIGYKKLVFISKKNSYYTLKDIINKHLRIGVVKRCGIYKSFAEAVTNVAGKKKFTEIKYFKLKGSYLNSIACKKDLFKNKIDVCVDWAGNEVWQKDRDKINAYIVNQRLYKEHLVYAFVLKSSDNKKDSYKFIDFAIKEFQTISHRRNRDVMKFLLPDLPL